MEMNEIYIRNEGETSTENEVHARRLIP